MPKDTVLITEVHHNTKTYPFHRIQGKCFPKHAHINFYGNDIARIWSKKEDCYPEESYIRSIKSILYRSRLVRDFAKWVFHHRDEDYHENRMRKKCAKCYSECFNMSCVRGTNHRVNHPDFDQFLSIKDSARIIEQPYVVFIDDFFPYHPETNVNYEIDNLNEIAVAYHQTMNSFFDYVEKVMKCKVVIAAHPYANYLTNNPFNGREIYYGKTAQLIKDCEAACQHCSNAYSYVALFNKPIAFVTNCALEKSSGGFATRLCGERFGIQAFYTDDLQTYPMPLFRRMDDSLRRKYINDYLGDMSDPRPNKELIRKCIEEFHVSLLERIG